MEDEASEPLLEAGGGDKGRSRVRSSQENRPRVTIELDNVSFDIQTKQGTKRILHPMSTVFCPGRLVALMGPSGAGKTTLLGVLSGNSGLGKLKGSVRVNGAPIPDNFKRFACVVPQDDVLLAGLTARETFTFVARLRLPKHTTPEERDSRVQQLLHQLNLEDCADTRVGNVDNRGMSGGQRKRVSIGQELLTDPAVMFVDEPTSGLDSKMADEVVRWLADLAHDNRTIICTIHQPSFRIFSRFNDLVLLTQGHLVYSGKVDACMAHLSDIGVQVPQQENPAEVWMELLQDQEHIGKLVDSWKRPAGEEGSNGGSEVLLPLPRTSTSYPVSYVTQAAVLSHRALADHFKDPQKYLATLIVKVIIGVLVGIVWIHQARDHTQPSIFPTQGVFFVVFINSAMDTIMQTALAIPLTRALLLREHRNGYYALFPHFVGMLVSHGIAQSLNSLVLAVPVYFLVGLQMDVAKFLVFTLALVCAANIGVGFGLFVGAVADDFTQAQQVVAPALIPLILFSGYMIPYPQIPWYFRWLYYCSFFQYGVSILEINQFHGIEFTDCPPGDPLCFHTGDELLHKQHVNHDHLWFNFGILAANYVLVVVLGYLATRHVLRSH